MACGGAISGLETLGNLATSGAESDGPAVTSVSHGPWSSLPTGIAFDPSTAVDAERLPAWVEGELGVRIEPAGTVVGPDGEELRRFRQTHRGLPIRGAAYTAHLQDERVKEVTGIAFDGASVDIEPTLSVDGAAMRVIARQPELLPLESPTLEILPVLGPGETRFYLAYVVPTLDPEGGGIWAVHVDAHTGKVVKVEALSSAVIPVDSAQRAPARVGNPQLSVLSPAASQETSAGAGINTDGQTLVFETEHTSDITSPEDGIVVEDLREGYRLRDVGRNLHTMSLDGATDIKTFVLREKEDGGFQYVNWDFLAPAHELIEEDNFWESDPDAVDVHWALGRVYDYFLDTHGRRGWDGQNGYTLAVVRYWHDYAQAAFHSAGRFLFFGDGGSRGRSFTSPDIVAHEFSHMVTGSIVDLKGFGEAGSIKEALADIFAVHATFGLSETPWRIGSDVDPLGIRDLSEPKARSMPDTYEGDHWGEYRSDFGRSLGLKERTRHENSTVMGYWFYLLSEAGEGENDHGEEYDIEEIGKDVAADIVYRALFRLHPLATFEDVREATIHVTRSLYGRCSEELRQVTNAWNAVGVGEPFCDCFEGSFTYVLDTDQKPERARFYVRGDDYAVEMTADDGSTHIMNTTAGDPYRHVQGQPELSGHDPVGGYLRNLMYGRKPLLRRPSKPMTRREYLQYREAHRTGRSGRLGEYETHEYRLDGHTVWSTEDVCMDITDYAGLFMMDTPELGDAMRQVFFGFPVELRGTGYGHVWIEDLREHEVDDGVFRP